MPRIPTVTSTVSPRSDLGGAIGTRTNAQAEGAGVAVALGNLGAQISSTGYNVVADEKRRTAKEERLAAEQARKDQIAQNATAKAKTSQAKLNVAHNVAQEDFTPRELELRNEVPPTADGYRDRVRSEYINDVDRKASSIKDDEERALYKSEMIKKLPEISARAAKWEFNTRSAHNKDQANASVSAVTNRARLGIEDPKGLLLQGEQVINASPNYSGEVKQGMKLQLGFSLWNAEFDGKVERAKTPDEVEALEVELNGPNSEYVNRLMPADFDRLSGALVTKRKALKAEFKAEATSIITTLTDRSNDITAIIPQEELAAASKAVQASGDPKLIDRMARIERDQYIKQNYGKVPLTEMDRDLTGRNARYPGVNPTLASSITQATRDTGVPEDYVARFVSKAYPQREAAKVQKQFQPVASQRRVNMKGLDADVTDALTVAGQILGEQLIVTDGKRVLNDLGRKAFNLDFNKPDVVKHGHDGVTKESYHSRGRGVDLRIHGKSEAEKAAMVGALVDAGFTGVGVYDDHIHADFRDSVPKTFGEKDGKPWGGWTNLTPEVKAELDKRNFKAGAKADELIRASAVQSYSSKSMRTASAEYVTDERVKSMMENIGQSFTPEAAAEMRKDPDAMIKLVSMNASKNAEVFKDATGQEASAMELSMADDLGIAQAIGLVRSLDNDVSLLVGEVMPGLIETNPEVAQQTVRDAYNSYAGNFLTEASQMTYGDQQTKRKVRDRVEKGLKDDPVTLAMQMNMTEIDPLDGAEGFAKRGEDMRYIADLHGKRVQDLKPFASGELQDVERTLGEGSVEQVLALVSSVQSMGDDVAAAAAKQIGDVSPVVSYAAELQRATGSKGVASAVIRGSRRLKDNPAMKATLGMTDKDLSNAVQRVTRGSMSLMDPEQAQAMTEAAFAYAVESRALSGATKPLKEKDIEKALSAVMGGDVIHDIGTGRTILPIGLDGATYKKAAKRMSLSDYTSMSKDKSAPSYGNGLPVSTDDLEDEARLMPIGGGYYNMLMDDGTYIMSGSSNKRFMYKPEVSRIQEIAKRPSGTPSLDGGVL